MQGLGLGLGLWIKVTYLLQMTQNVEQDLTGQLMPIFAHSFCTGGSRAYPLFFVEIYYLPRLEADGSHHGLQLVVCLFRSSAVLRASVKKSLGYFKVRVGVRVRVKG